MSTVKEDLINRLSLKTKRRYKKVILRDFVNTFFDEISGSLTEGENVKLTGFGSFNITTLKSRIGRNPKTKVEVVIPATRTVSFKPSPKLCNKIIPPKNKFRRSI